MNQMGAARLVGSIELGVGVLMVLLAEKLEAREEAARSWAGELQERIAELSERLDMAPDDLARWVIAREVVNAMVAERSDVRDPVVAPFAVAGVEAAGGGPRS
ncbi:hypothetical protein ACFC0M_06470 [Streptomyces sp. NPDC056149]|uniref:hypothetical protein n=1 Tax=Streptomyces sp. NPDC056149 TaxID=3345728 RepID=UPI0035D81E92